MRSSIVAGQPGLLNAIALVKVLPCAKFPEVFPDCPFQLLFLVHQGTSRPPSNSSNLGIMVQGSDPELGASF